MCWDRVGDRGLGFGVDWLLFRIWSGVRLGVWVLRVRARVLVLVRVGVSIGLSCS